MTGASSGIGAGIVRLLPAQGAKIVATARRAGQIERLDGVTAFAADLRRPEDLERVAALGPVEFLVSCAGGSWPTTPGSGEDVRDEAFALNVTAVRKPTTALLPAMRACKWGHIVNISGSMEPRSLNAAIAAKGLSCAIAADGVTLNTLQPGRIDSEQIREKLHPTEESRRSFIERNIPIGYFGDPADVAHLAAFLASPAARYITGAVIPVDGGMHYFAH